MNADYNITTIIRATFNQENIRSLLDRGQKIGLKYHSANSQASSYEQIIDQAISNINTHHNQTKIEIITTFETFRFLFILEDGYSSKANERGLTCHFNNIIIQELSAANIKRDNSKIINLMLKLIAEYFIFELHAQEGEYRTEEDL